MIRSAVRRLIVVVLCLLFIPSAASASSIFFDMDRIDDFVFPSAQFAAFIEIEIKIDATGVTDEDVTGVMVTMGTLSVPTVLTEDGIWEEASDLTFSSLTALKNAVSGTWTIVVTGGANASTSTFTFNANGLLDSDFPPTVTGLSPANGATGVSANTLLSWTAISSQIVVGVFAGNDSGEQETDNLFGGLSLNASSWQPPLALPDGLDEWGVFYARDPLLTVDLVGDIALTAGTITWSPHELVEVLGIGWPAAKPLMAVGSETIVEITVPEPAEVLQSGMALATLGLLAQLRARRRDFADAT